MKENTEPSIQEQIDELRKENIALNKRLTDHAESSLRLFNMLQKNIDGLVEILNKMIQ